MWGGVPQAYISTVQVPTYLHKYVRMVEIEWVVGVIVHFAKYVEPAHVSDVPCPPVAVGH